MIEDMNPIKNQCRKIIETKPDYRKAEFAYLRYMMKDLDQEVLMETLDALNIRELKMAIGAGVPGHAMYKANELLTKKKEKMELFIESEGTEASAVVEKEDEKEVEDVGKSRVRSSETE